MNFFFHNFLTLFLEIQLFPFLPRCIDEVLKTSHEGNEKRADNNVVYMDLGRNKWSPGKADTDSQLVMSVNALAARFEFDLFFLASNYLALLIILS